jgi:hypothetical protein
MLLDFLPASFGTARYPLMRLRGFEGDFCPV